MHDIKVRGRIYLYVFTFALFLFQTVALIAYVIIWCGPHERKLRTGGSGDVMTVVLPYREEHYIVNMEQIVSGLIGALPPGAVHPYAAPPMAFPGPPMLTPMMHPRFR